MTKPSKVLIVEARFYDDLADDLAAGAVAVLDDAGVAYERRAVPGCFELPAAIALALPPEDGGAPDGDAFDGFIALGVVIRGETDHYDFICREVCRGLMDLSINECIALGFGVLTCETYAQAAERAAVKGKNKGASAAEACLRMMELAGTLKSTGG